MRLLAWIIALPLALVAVVFAVANRHPVRLDFWPLPWSADLPVFLAVLGALVAGLLLGALLAWMSGHRSRRRARDESRRAQSLARQLQAARQDADAARATELPPPV